MTIAPEQLLLDSPAARPCLHPRVHHEHGTKQAYGQDGCRCPPCTAAATQYSNHRRRQRAYGRWTAYVDATPVREHVDALMRAGVGWRTIAKRAGLAPETVQRLLYGVPYRDQPPARRVRPHTAEALLGVASGRTRRPETPNLLTKGVTAP